MATEATPRQRFWIPVVKKTRLSAFLVRELRTCTSIIAIEVLVARIGLEGLAIGRAR